MNWEDILGRLTEQEREAWNLAVADRSYSSIGSQMGVPARVVGRLVRSANKKMLAAAREAIARNLAQ